MEYSFFSSLTKLSIVSESSNLCENTRVCLDPKLKDYGLVAFTLTYLSAEQE